MRTPTYLLLFLLLFPSILSCSSKESTAPNEVPGTPTPTATAPSTPDTPPEWNRTVTPLSAEEAAQKRSSCGFQAGALPAETLGDATPNGPSLPIEHFVLVMMENRSFDHYFQMLKEAGVADVDVAPPDFSNKTLLGKEETIRPMKEYCIADVAHSWNRVHEQFNDGKMDGFVTSNEGEGHDGARALGYLTEQSAPVGYFLAKNFAISDRHFCSLLGPTWPNRMYFYAASSFGLTNNTITSEKQNNILEHLGKRGIEWGIYRQDTPGIAMFFNTLLQNKDRIHLLSQFQKDAQEGTLPTVTYVDPGLIGNAAVQSSQHPPANHQYGEQFLYDIVKAVTESPLWPKTALIITYDEHGGFYDHVPPPTACPPDDRSPEVGSHLGAFDRYGIRVPLTVISPFAKKNYVSHVVTDHTSVLRLLELKFQLPAMTNRDANAEALLDMFDFQNPPFLTPPQLPPRPEIDPAQDSACKASFH